MSSPYSEINSSPTDNSTPYIVRQLVNSPDAANLYESVKSQNKMIDVESSSLRDKYSTDNQRSKYMINNIMNWNYLNFYLWIAYYIVVLVIFYLFIKGNIELPQRIKIYISVGLLLYPFLISTIELAIYNFLQLLKSVIIGIPYPKHTRDQPSFSVFNGLPSLYY